MKNMDNKKVDEIYIKETVECFNPLTLIFDIGVIYEIQRYFVD